MSRRQQGGRKPARMPGPTQVSARLALPFLGEISGVWEPADAERRASWELYLELASRVSVVELDREQGLLREAISSLYSLFGTTRDILRRYGPEVAPPLQPGHVSFGVLAMTTLNRVLRPLLTRWHPRLAAYESQRPQGTDPVAYERAWEHAEQLRSDIAAVREALLSLALTLQQVAGVGDLIRLDAPLPPQPPVPPQSPPPSEDG
ncbi:MULTISPECIES: hypothetical protein [unclassified Streptomyces]|uniref:hypothetical protein n=1 Tax=unclassified Streptomyces TaxID=2593676 RepID=UPI002DD871B0|nr:MULTISPECIES: hypothetical protein [unclassified Streptomyces]WSA95576.1 hypothetical protein OIE63_31420 [Streptomyces sp. NBC_01795]WSB79992.1 hypothetical protein OHB04_32535 [Streptomyces sp. NBC_01775]WSS11800.1 hypothetical protein OG533_07675 [Streptomyces sp. NBC_01186]WSS40514.1 hypothetical protein OG220_07830 [Streptomyces sp. NBC_01187]